MNRFKNEKFKLVAKRKFIPNDVLSKSDGLPSKVRPDKPKKKVRLARLANDGFEYKADVDVTDGNRQDVPPGNPPGGTKAGNEDNEEIETLEGESDDGDGDRNLWIFNPDTRYEITSRPSWPTSLNGRTAIGCSGTIINRDAVLTAGHCVHSGGSGGYWRNADFSPSQYRTSSNRVVKPYGTWRWRHITTYQSWTRDRNFNHDIAVVRYFTPATYLGYAGLRRTSSSSPFLDRRIYNAGYPSDKASPNTEMWESYCGDVFRHSSDPYTVRHTCDIYYGNSGGSFMDSFGYVHAVQSWQLSDGSINGAVLLNGYHYDDVLRWAGR